MSIELLGLIFTIVGGTVATLLLVRPTINAVKWLLSPRLDIDFSEHSKGRIKKGNPKEIEVTANKPIKVEIRILPQWTYKLRIIEVLGYGLRIERTRIFVKEPREWMKGDYTDLEGNYKIPLHDFVIRKGGITDPTLIDVKIPPIQKDQRKKISLRIETEESRTLFIKDLWISA